MIKVLMLVSNLRAANGVASFAINYYKNLDHSKVQMDFALYSDRESTYYSLIEECGGKIFVLPSIKKMPEHIKACNEILERRAYDVIHDNTLHISIPMMWCAKQTHVPIRVLHSHNTKMGEKFGKEIRNKCFLPIIRGLATDNAACSIDAGKAMFGNRSFEVIPNVVSTEKYKFDMATRLKVRKLMKTTEKLIVGTVGRLAEQKNPFFAVDVFEKLLKRVPNVEYWWIGSGGLDNQVIDYVEKKNLSQNVKILGSRADVLDLYQAMDCFFLPSLFEGLPVTGVEAQAMGLPMVVSDTITKEMEYSDLIDYVGLNEKPEIWAEHLKLALERTIEREKYSEKLKMSIFSDIGCGDRLLSIYQKILQKGNV